MNVETRTYQAASQRHKCQNCTQDFVIEPEDFAFYEKIKVPAPTFCPDCRRQRRFAFRNTHTLYKRKDSFTGKDIISIYSPDKELTVIDQNDWWKDNWDPMDYGRDYDFEKPFFMQWSELRDVIPLQSLSNSKAVNSDYCNVAEENYDCYLVTACYQNERVLYSDSIYFDKDCMDVHVVYSSEFCYDDVNCSDSYTLFYSQDSHACADSYFLYDCRGCTNCFMSSNLRNKSYVFRNEQLSKEAYQEKLSTEKLSSYAHVTQLKKEFEQLKLAAVHKYANITNSHNATGNNIDHAKNAQYCFDVSDGTEDCKYMFWGGIKTQDAYDTDACAVLDQAYEIFDVGAGGKRCFFGSVVYYSSDMEYCFNCYGCSDVFGCIGLRNKSYCILNKQYSKEDYFALREKVIQHMNENAYVDSKGREYRYGEYFPVELSPFAYNETVAHDYFPLTKEQALNRGYAWKDKREKHHSITIKNGELPDDIQDVSEDILKNVIGCEHAGSCEHRCATAFKIVPAELTFYKRFNIPLPRLCYGCRHAKRFNTRTPLQLWQRKCMCTQENHDHTGRCANSFKTAYSDERSEIIYCESCYQKEVY